MFYEQIIYPIWQNIQYNGDANAFNIAGTYYTYQQFGEKIAAIRHLLNKDMLTNKCVGLVINDDIETYAAIFALWFDGLCYVPLHPNWPLERCKDIIAQIQMGLILDSSKVSRYDSKIVLRTCELECSSSFIKDVYDIKDSELAYILFTSGSTGQPKGVQLSRENLASFVYAFTQIYQLSPKDRCLQCFDLSFDLSIISYLLPLVNGACVYTVPNNVIKYAYIGELIEDQQLTFALMAPSTIKFLKPYFDEFDCSSLKYSLFCGEALHEDITREWSMCAVNAIIDNVYGPTEDTIFCSTYRFHREGINKSYNGVLSIGQPMANCGMEVFNENREICAVDELGELCLSGKQLTPGYHNNEAKNQEAFFVKDGVRWYRSGDLCYKDADGDIMYSGRLDHQAKIQGYRVELGEIEYHAHEYLKDKNVVCLAYDNQDGIAEIAMFIEAEPSDSSDMLSYMRNKMPAYMIPSQIIFISSFPINQNGKTDKKALKEKITLNN